MSRSMDDTLLFREEKETGARPLPAPPWPILVVDDDPEVHAMTRVLLRDYRFDGRPFEVVSARSAEDAYTVLAQCPEIPVILLDVIMETDDSGLQLVRRIREELGNRRVRIILRTGQPGEAPESNVVVNYDINDYKTKTELTSQKMFTAIVGALRSWRDIVAIEQHRHGLERILNTTAPLFKKRSMRALTEGIVAQLHTVLDSPDGSSLACRISDRSDALNRMTVIAGSGAYSGMAGQPVSSCLPADLLKPITQAFETQRSSYGPDRCILAFRTLEHGTTVILFQRALPFTPDDHRLLELFCSRVAIGFDNVCLYEDMMALNATLEQRVATRTAELAAKQEVLIAAKERTEKALRRELEASLRQRQFLAMVSHEFRTPLAVIDSAAQMLALQIDDGASGAAARLQSIRGSTRRLNALIDTYLADDQLQGGSLQLQPRRFDLAAALRGLAETYRSLSPDGRFTLDLDGVPESVWGDPELLTLVFSNLLNNAVKYSAAPPVIELKGAADGTGLTVSVRDSGVGIPAAEIPHVFDRLFRGAGSADIPGTGIGLYLARQIVEMHGGTIGVESAVGDGSIFTVFLPTLDDGSGHE